MLKAFSWEKVFHMIEEELAQEICQKQREFDNTINNLEDYIRKTERD